MQVLRAQQDIMVYQEDQGRRDHLENLERQQTSPISI